jgi:NAD(P) transhydrogenase subunit alpha
MRIAVARETDSAEDRVAATPETVRKMKSLGAEVVVEPGAGVKSGFPDTEYTAAGATIVKDAAKDADVVLKVRRPGALEVGLYKPGALVIAIMDPFGNESALKALAGAGIVTFAMELMPRITRAQSMDVLSSQANLAGYRSVLDAAAEFGRALPMMMTAAGTIKAARVLVMGAGVAGLQAIATARRLGAIVSATDVRAAAKEQVASLGATFITVDEDAMKAAETSGGYAREMDEDFQRRQREKITETLRRTDIVICTALIPGKQAPILLTEAMVAALAPGSVIVDLAVESGGNVEGSRAGEIVTTANGVKIVGHINMAARVPVDASQLYARNLLAFLALIVDKEGRLRIDTADEIVKAALLTMDGAIVNPALMPEPAFAAAATS